MEIKIKVDDGETLEQLRKMSPERFLRAWAIAVKNLAKRKAQEAAAKSGGRSFWQREILPSVHEEVTPTSAQVYSDSHIAEHVHTGGVIRKKNDGPRGRAYLAEPQGKRGKLKWKAQCTSETLLQEILCENSRDADEEYMKLYAMDEEGLTFPYIVNTGLARYSPERSDWTGCCRLEKQETANGWKVEAEIPRALFRGKNRILFGVERIEYIGSDERATPYPAGEFKNDLRLNLSYFMPDKLVLLHLDR